MQLFVRRVDLDHTCAFESSSFPGCDSISRNDCQPSSVNRVGVADLSFDSFSVLIMAFLVHLRMSLLLIDIVSEVLVEPVPRREIICPISRPSGASGTCTTTN